MLITYGFVSLGLLFAFVVFRWLVGDWIPKGLRLPPGPPRKLLFGNLSDLPTQREWETYSKWAKTYGDIVYIKVLGQSMVFINSLELGQKLFEKRSSIYSDRRVSPMLSDLMGLSWVAAFIPYGDEWRQQRKVFQQVLHPNIVPEYHTTQTKHTRNLLLSYNDSPRDFVQHIRHAAGAIIMEITYGITVLPKDDPYIATADKTLRAIEIASTPGAFLVETLPLLKYVPEWFPGTNFLQKAKEWRNLCTDVNTIPFNAVKKAMDAGTANPSIVLSLLEQRTAQSETSSTEENTIRNAAGTIFIAGADTVVTSLETFMLAMVLYPEVQRIAQKELDDVLGPDRLPEFSDCGSLPYINALCKEVLRWQPVTPLGFPHKLSQNDIVGEYFIPAGTIVLGNAWHMLHDETIYGSETEKFKPERFLDHDININPAFGFGRRVCAGRYMAENFVFIAIASILKVFDLSLPTDANGKATSPKAEFTPGLLSTPLPFECKIEARSDAARKLIMDISGPL